MSDRSDRKKVRDKFQCVIGMREKSKRHIFMSEGSDRKKVRDIFLWNWEVNRKKVRDMFLWNWEVNRKKYVTSFSV